jgi:hypothetical protein
MFVTFGNDPPRHCEAQLFRAWQSVAPAETASSPFPRRAPRSDAAGIVDPVPKHKRGISPFARKKGSITELLNGDRVLTNAIKVV